jgi:hypothetical protein
MKNLLALGLVALFAAPMVQAQKTAPRRAVLKEADVRVDKQGLVDLKRDIEAKLGLGEHSRRAVDALAYVRSENLPVAQRLVRELTETRNNLAIFVPRQKLDAVNSKVNELVALELEALAYDRASVVSGKSVSVFGEKMESEIAEYVTQVRRNVEEFSGRDPDSGKLIEAKPEALDNQIKIARDTVSFLLKGSTGLVSAAERSANPSQQVYSLQYARKMAGWSFLVEKDNSLNAWSRKFPESARNSKEYRDAKRKALEEVMKDPTVANKWQELLKCLLGASLAKAA